MRINCNRASACDIVMLPHIDLQTALHMFVMKSHLNGGY